MSWARRASSIAVSAALGLTPELASASEAEARADSLFREGKALLERGEIAAACERLAQSQALDPGLGTLGLLALCHERQGKTASAWREYRAVAELARAQGQAERERVALTRARELEPKLAKLTVRVPRPVPNLVVELDGEAIEPGEALPVDAGSLVLRARAPGHRDHEQVVRVAAGPSEQSLTLPALEPNPPADQPERAPSFLERNPVALTALGVGVVGLAVGTVFGLTARSKNQESDAFCDASNRCDPRGIELRDAAIARATWSTVGFAVGVVGVATGTTLLVLERGPSGRNVRLELSDGLGAQLGGRF